MKAKTKKALKWTATIIGAICATILTLIETSCCPHLIKNISDGYEKMYETIFYTINQDGDTSYYVSKQFEELKNQEKNQWKN